MATTVAYQERPYTAGKRVRVCVTHVVTRARRCLRRSLDRERNWRFANAPRRADANLHTMRESEACRHWLNSRLLNTFAVVRVIDDRRHECNVIERGYELGERKFRGKSLIFQKWRLWNFPISYWMNLVPRRFERKRGDSLPRTIISNQVISYFHRKSAFTLGPWRSRPRERTNTKRDLDALVQAPAAWICMQIPSCLHRVSGNRSTDRS